jgi:alkylation response protein AidB-like acyl-CoA dehydrogenase
MGTGAMGAYLGDAAVDEMFGGERFPVVAGRATQPGSASRRADGSYVLGGNWNFGSGISHADWVLAAGLVGDRREFRVFLVPRERVVVTENWDVLGLRATGSHDYAINAVPVTPDFTHARWVDSSVRGGGLYRLSSMGIGLIGHTGWAIGVGRRVLDELLALVEERADAPRAFAADSNFHAGLAEAEARYRAARALAYEVWEEVEEDLTENRPISTRRQTLIRLALNHVTWTSQAISQFAYSSAGTSALRAGSLQRVFRDLHAGVQHVIVSSAVLQACGRELTGLYDTGEWRGVAFDSPG